MKNLCFLFILLFCIPVPHVFCQAEQSAGPSEKSTSFGLFEKDDLLEISLYFDLSLYLRKKPKEEYLKARITFNPGKPDSISKKIKLRTRGEFRNQYCMFAPIELSFKNTDFGFSDLDSIEKLKLVTQCSSGAIEEGYIMKEYLCYKLFSAFTDTSFRVRLLKINYIDSEKKRKSVTQYGFFIEPIELLTARTGTVQLKTTAITQKHITPYSMDRLSIFNYMIGNYDWSVPGQHNVRVLKSGNVTRSQLGIAIPYDFDWSGVVNASYAIPTDETGIKSVRERLFLGICRDDAVFRKDLDLFSERKDSLYSIINDFAMLRQRDKTDIIQFLDSFFISLRGDRRSILSYFQSRCKRF